MVDGDAVRQQLDRLLQSTGFTGANRLSRLLRYVVERTLAGEGGDLKEYALGIEVFDRDDKYDPRLDSIVRVQAGRLRSKVEEYYAGEGARDQVRIRLLRGSYVPRFEYQAVTGSTEVLAGPGSQVAGVERRSGGTFWPLFIALTLAVLTAIWLAAGRAPAGAVPGPAIVVLPFEPHSNSVTGHELASRLTDGVTIELASLGTLGVVSRTTARQLEGTQQSLRDIATAVGANGVMEASVEMEGDGVLVWARLVDATTDRKFWVKDYRSNPEGLHDLERRVAADVSGVVLTRRVAPPSR